MAYKDSVICIAALGFYELKALQEIIMSLEVCLMNKYERQSNIELLRIISMLGVIILHYNNKTFGGGLQYAIANSINYYILMVLESLCICAVNLFMLISGYFSCMRKRTTLQKPIALITQVVILSFAWNLICGVVKGTLTIKGIVASLVPANYFVILYIAVYLLSPYLNILYDRITNKFIILLFILFSIYPTLVEVFSQITGGDWFGLSTIGAYGSQWGYQIVNFILMYYMGMYIRKNIQKLEKIETSKLFLTLCGIVLLITVWSCISEMAGYSRNMAWIYCNPLVVVEAALVFIIFEKIDFGSVKWINQLSAACFTVFLVHGYFITHIKIDWAVHQNVFIMSGHILICVILIYLAGFVVYKIFDFFWKKVYGVIGRKDIVITQL